MSVFVLTLPALRITALYGSEVLPELTRDT